ncbi:ABC transporter ATP-binding protein [Spiroplasma endosymbiont of Crioceris asparagi]|uniref:ABC transporter ATP-binding protein n=1 Tax=Spiroplasma endosymbiont of Crioceris asparagi TaxID=3066286 RepID=UPI003BAEAE32
MEHAVKMENITKVFNGTLYANKNINLFVKHNTIHALVGENGAGKSTLMSILFGLYEPTEGEIFINDSKVKISNPIVANKLKIGMVHQHFKLVEVKTVWENIVLGIESGYGPFVNKNKIKREITDVMKKYNLFVDLDAKIKDISVGMQQRVEIIKVLFRQANIIVFDEPTAVLTPQQIDGFLEIVKNLKNNGKTIIFITHKIDEIMAVADEATVIRNGENVAEFKISEIKGDEIPEAMVGRKLVEVKNQYKNLTGEKILEIFNLTVKKESNPRLDAIQNLSLTINRGEILAIAGLEGSGQKELVEALVGLKKQTAGAIVFKGKYVTKLPIVKRKKMGISHVPEDRHKYGLVLDMSVSENMVLDQISNKEFSNKGLINKSKMKKYSRNIIEEFDVRGARDGDALSRALSGGNQQKAIVGREMIKNHDLLIVFQPTRGLDVGAIEFIHEKILEEKNQNKAVLLISYELNEIMALADKIAVINKGKIVKTINAQGVKKEEIGKLMAGNNYE